MLFLINSKIISYYCYLLIKNDSSILMYQLKTLIINKKLNYECHKNNWKRNARKNNFIGNVLIWYKLWNK